MFFFGVVEAGRVWIRFSGSVFFIVRFFGGFKVFLGFVRLKLVAWYI